MRCPKCGIQKPCLDTMESHLALNHLNWQPWHCNVPDCSAKRCTQQELEEHCFSMHGLDEPVMTCVANPSNRAELKRLMSLAMAGETDTQSVLSTAATSTLPCTLPPVPASLVPAPVQGHSRNAASASISCSTSTVAAQSDRSTPMFSNGTIEERDEEIIVEYKRIAKLDFSAAALLSSISTLSSPPQSKTTPLRDEITVQPLTNIGVAQSNLDEEALTSPDTSQVDEEIKDSELSSRVAALEEKENEADAAQQAHALFDRKPNVRTKRQSQRKVAINRRRSHALPSVTSPVRKVIRRSRSTARRSTQRVPYDKRQCAKCDTFVAESMLRLHAYKHLVDERKASSFKCSSPGCDFKSYRKSGVAVHIHQKHKDEQCEAMGGDLDIVTQECIDECFGDSGDKDGEAESQDFEMEQEIVDEDNVKDDGSMELLFHNEDSTSLQQLRERIGRATGRDEGEGEDDDREQSPYETEPFIIEQ